MGRAGGRWIVEGAESAPPEVSDVLKQYPTELICIRKISTKHNIRTADLLMALSQIKAGQFACEDRCVSWIRAIICNASLS